MEPFVELTVEPFVELTVELTDVQPTHPSSSYAGAARTWRPHATRPASDFRRPRSPGLPLSRRTRRRSSSREGR